MGSFDLDAFYADHCTSAFLSEFELCTDASAKAYAMLFMLSARLEKGADRIKNYEEAEASADEVIYWYYHESPWQTIAQLTEKYKEFEIRLKAVWDTIEDIGTSIEPI